MKVRVGSFFATILFLVSFSASAIAQSKNESSFFVRSNVLVTDDAKNYVNDLTKDDLILTENGVVQPITYFAKRQSPLNVAIVLDSSGSVTEQLHVIKAIGKYVVANLMAGDEAQLIGFSDSAFIREEWTGTLSKLNLALDALKVEIGQTAIIDGTYVVTEDVVKRYDSRTNGRYAIVLISDFEDRANHYKEKSLFKLIGKRDIPIFTVALTANMFKDPSDKTRDQAKILQKAEDLSNSLAIKSGGTTYLLGTGAKEEDYQAAMKALVLELRSQYVIGYEAKDVNKTTTSRTIQIVAKDGPKGEKRSVIARSTILLPTN